MRVSCQTIAGPTGTPVAGSHTTVVSRWLLMPTPATSAAPAPTSCSTRVIVRTVLRQISAASCSTQPGRG